MNSEPHKDTSCKKVRFVNEEAALFYIQKLKKTSKRARKPVNAYLCPQCLSWHLTSIESKENKQLIYKDREIVNLKKKIDHLNKEIQRLKSKIK